MENSISLGRLLKDFLKKNEIPQKELYCEIKCQASYLCNVLSSKTIPSDEFLQKVSHILGVDLKLLLIKANYERTLRSEKSKENNKSVQKVARAWNEILSFYLNSQEDHVEHGNTKPGKTLLNFPYEFDNLQIICGDKREDPPETIGDLFALSPSTIDLSAIHKLGIYKSAPNIKSDKVFYFYRDRNDSRFRDLQKKYRNCNLLVIGSQAANLMSREVNCSAVFRFNNEFHSIKRINEMKKEIWEDSFFVRRLRNYHAKHKEEIKRLNKSFKVPGFIDPIIRDRQGFYIPHNKDFGVISIARNPFADEDDYEHLAILAAGVHLPGTVAALGFLTNSNNFAKHPLGGIIEVDISDTLSYEDRFEMLSTEWQTKDYTIEELKESLKIFKEDHKEKSELFITEKEIDDIIKLVDSLDV